MASGFVCGKSSAVGDVVEDAAFSHQLSASVGMNLVVWTT
jgi:hypothetical protein